MNACLRAVVRTALTAKHEVIGFRRGFQGLLDEDFFINDDGQRHFTLRSVGNLVKTGGTILHSSRSAEFQTDDGQRKAAKILQKHDIDALIPIGGDGTFHGAVALAQHWKGQIVGCPGTIDNDLLGTDYTIGFHTAVNTAVEAVDKLRDTADSHERLFLVEVMGRHSGYIPTYTALAGGAECVCIPETPTEIPQIISRIQVLKDRGKSSIMLIVAEGDEAGGATKLNEALMLANCPYPTRVVILGHLQRGGVPVPLDRILASRLGGFAVKSLTSGMSGVMTGEVRGELILTPFEETYDDHKLIPDELLKLLDTLSN
jgi:6-phosphofructokinase 1